MNNLKRKNKQYYKQSGLNTKKSKKSLDLDMNLKGFLITCNNNEKQTVAEAYNILNEYADALYGNVEALKQEGSEDEDIESILQNQINSLKSVNNKRFLNLNTHINNCIFINTTLPDPSELLHKIFDTDKPTNVRYILRILPVVKTCRTNVESIEKMAEEQLLPVFANVTPAPSFSIMSKIRNNNSINKGTIYSVIGRVVSSINPMAKVHLDDPEIVISVDVMQKICCLSILPHYKKFKKYNLHEMKNLCTKQSNSILSTNHHDEDENNITSLGPKIEDDLLKVCKTVKQTSNDLNTS